MSTRVVLCWVIGWVSMVGLTGCETPGQSAMAGAAAGAFLGGSIKGSGRDMARGAALGAAGGYVLGKVAESDRSRSGSGAVYAGGGYPVAPVGYAQVPWGRFSGRHGFVYSPFSNRLIDARGVPRGAQVVDPFTGQVFRNP